VLLQWLTINLYISIVCVHGLGGGYETWIKDDVLWPRDLLPAVLPQARVFLFGHNYSVMRFFASSKETSTASNSGEELREELAKFRRRSRTVSTLKFPS